MWYAIRVKYVIGMGTKSQRYQAAVDGHNSLVRSLEQSEKTCRFRRPEPEYSVLTQLPDSWGLSAGCKAFADFFLFGVPTGTLFLLSPVRSNMKHDAFSKYHPLVSFLFFALTIVFGVVIQHPAYLLAGVLSGGIYLSLLIGRKVFRWLMALIPLFLLVAFVNPLLNHRGSTVLCYVFSNPYTLEALLHGMATGNIFVIMMLWFACYSQVLTSDKFICLFGRLIPTLSLLLVMVLRLIPSFMRKTSQLTGARKCIGKSGDAVSFRGKVASGMTVLSALTDHALEGSITTADSMRSRGYGSGKRTSFQIYRFTPRDFILIAIIAALTSGILAFGGNAATYTPAVEIDRVGGGLICYFALCFIPIILQIKEAVQWHISISRI